MNIETKRMRTYTLCNFVINYVTVTITYVHFNFLRKV